MIRKNIHLSMALIIPMVILCSCAYLQPEVYRVSQQAREPAERFLRENACLGMSIQEFRDKIRHPRAQTESAERIVILRENEDSLEIGTKGKVGLRANFRDGKFAGSSYWFVEVAGSWSRPSDREYAPCFKNAAGKIMDMSFAAGAGKNLRLSGVRGTTKRALNTAYIGEYQILNWDSSTHSDYEDGPVLPLDTQVTIFEKFNAHVYPVSVNNETGYKVLFLPSGSKLEDVIDFTAGYTVPHFVE